MARQLQDLGFKVFVIAGGLRAWRKAGRTMPVLILTARDRWSDKVQGIDAGEVEALQVPATPGTCAWPPSLPSVPTSRATRVTSEVNTLSC